jgi:hypothetical protein
LKKYSRGVALAEGGKPADHFHEAARSILARVQGGRSSGQGPSYASLGKTRSASAKIGHDTGQPAAKISPMFLTIADTPVDHS